MRYIVLLIIGVSTGYGLGYHDARQHDKSVVERMVEHFENANRERMGGADADKKLEEIERK
jgi:hypothetical protein